MMRTFHPKYERVSYDIFAGEFYVTKDQSILISTLLGSCVAVCLRDSIAGISGMNHYMLPWKNDLQSITQMNDGRYGYFALDYMIQKMVQQGANPNKLEAKIFGGGRIMDKSSSQISEQNVRFAKAYLEMHRIPVLVDQTGGFIGRRIFMFPDTFHVEVRTIEKYDGREPVEIDKPVGVERTRRTIGDVGKTS